MIIAKCLSFQLYFRYSLKLRNDSDGYFGDRGRNNGWYPGTGSISQYYHPQILDQVSI